VPVTIYRISDENAKMRFLVFIQEEYFQQSKDKRFRLTLPVTIADTKGHGLGISKNLNISLRTFVNTEEFNEVN